MSAALEFDKVDVLFSNAVGRKRTAALQTGAVDARCGS